eukprot:190975-Alexandrium_andersonii.AAC.1
MCIRDSTSDSQNRTGIRGRDSDRAKGAVSTGEGIMRTRARKQGPEGQAPEGAWARWLSLALSSGQSECGTEGGAHASSLS